MVCAATLVSRSVALAPLSVENTTLSATATGAKVSMARVGCTGAATALPAASVTAPVSAKLAATPWMPAVGVNSAVYTSGLAVAARPLKVPPLAMMAPALKPTGTSLKVNVTCVVSPTPSAALPLVMTSVGASVSTAIGADTAPMPRLPKASA
ncbi:hypothetical protein DUPY_01050 [Duganella phyllosphaerae]|uniref:Uncharacterized protein n=1 Tax=Duganella phyllosphaerae TaxID=762836 RepID=A0A1E7X7T7_9BURK|nr:hypothetical protein DUPY_01050 [Duganella phyllosphaerae]